MYFTVYKFPLSAKQYMQLYSYQPYTLLVVFIIHQSWQMVNHMVCMILAEWLVISLFHAYMNRGRFHCEEPVLPLQEFPLKIMKRLPIPEKKDLFRKWVQNASFVVAIALLVVGGRFIWA